MSRRRRSEAGAALLMALWFSAGAAILAMAFLQGARTETGIAAGALAATRARLAEEAAVAWSAARLLDEEIVLEPGGTALEWSFEDIGLGIAVSAESGRIDVNYAAIETLTELATKLGVEEDEVEALGEALADWRKEGEAEGVHIDRPPLGSRLLPPREHRLAHVAELRSLPGVPPAAYTALAPWLTVHTREPLPENSLLPPLLRVTPRGADGRQGQEEEASVERQDAPLDATPPDAGAPETRADTDPDADEDLDPRADPEAEAGTSGDRRTDPLQLYRLRIATRQPGGYTTLREVVLWLRPGKPRPYRILDFSAPLVGTGGREPRWRS
ncbi:type II secretion system protein GspK [Geminicoccaceae bacterium 1502E]|nr:type II secretion system protein GspK [Geminicoccaceae bacterium 1502E]